MDEATVEAALLAPLPAGWSAALSRQTRQLFYVNTLTGRTQQELPTSLATVSGGPALEPGTPPPNSSSTAPPPPCVEVAAPPMLLGGALEPELDTLATTCWAAAGVPSRGEVEAGLAASRCLAAAEIFLGGDPTAAPQRAAALAAQCAAAGKECLCVQWSLTWFPTTSQCVLCDRCVASSEEEYKAALQLFNTAWRLQPDNPAWAALIASASEASTCAATLRMLIPCMCAVCTEVSSCPRAADSLVNGMSTSAPAVCDSFLTLATTSRIACCYSLVCVHCVH
jgi:hypothetical protein